MKRLLCVVCALALAGCSSGGPELGMHPVAAKPAAAAHPAAAPYSPLPFSLDGVRFDALTPGQAVRELEARGFTLVKKSQLCDKFRPPASFDHAAWLASCWYGPRWAFTRLQWTRGSGPTRFFALARVLLRKYGQPTSHDLHPLYSQHARATWMVDGRRGEVRIVYGMKMHLTLEDVRCARYLAAVVKRAEARRNAHRAAGLGLGGGQ